MRSDLLSRPRPLRPQQQSRTHEPVPGGGAAAAVAPLLTHFFRGPPPVRFEFWDGTSLGPSRRRHAAGALTRRRAAAALVARGTRSGPGLRDGRPGLRGRHLRTSGDTARRVPDRTHVRLSSCPGRRCRRPSRLGVTRPATAPAARGGSAARPAAFARSRCPGGAAPLRRQQRLLRHGARASHDLLVRPVRAGCRDSGGRTGIEARPRVPQTRAWPTGTGQRILDVGCGWGSFAIHAARHYGARVVGVTLSPAQAGWGRDRVAAAGLEQQVEIRLQDYRDRARRPVRRHRVGWGCSSTSGPRGAASTSASCAGCSGPRAGCSTTPSRAWVDRASAPIRSSDATSSPTAS